MKKFVKHITCSYDEQFKAIYKKVLNIKLREYQIT